MTRLNQITLLVWSLLAGTGLASCSLQDIKTSRPLDLMTSRPLSVRRVQVLAVADPLYRALNPRWQKAIRHTIAKVSREYEQEFGIVFEVVRVAEWNPSPHALISYQFSEMKRGHPITHAYDLVVGFTSGSGLTLSGIADILGNHILVCQSPFSKTSSVLSHEMGHIFGARHTVMPSTMQYFALPLLGGGFSSASKHTITEHKWRAFRLPVCRATGTGRLCDT